MRPDIHVIALDETHNWDLVALTDHVGLTSEDELRKYLKSIEGCYWFNKNERTHCCEMTPAYCLWPYDHRARGTDMAMEDNYNRPTFNLTDPKYFDRIPILDRIESWVGNEPLTYDPFYVHCHVIKALIERYQKEGVDFRYRHFGDLDITEDELDSSGTWVERMTQAFPCDAPI